MIHSPILVMAMTNSPSEETTAVSPEKVNVNIVTLTRFLTEEQTKHKEATGDFTSVWLTYRNGSPSCLLTALF